MVPARRPTFFTFDPLRILVLDHPLSPGKTSAIEEGPWHYGADYVTVYFRAERHALANIVPEPFEVADGLCLGYVCEIVSVADSALEMASDRPDRTLYHEAAIGVKCKYAARPGTYFPVMWVTTEWSLLRGLLNGYQKRLADRISVTKLHPLNPGMGPVSEGSRFGGFCVKGPDQVLSLKVAVKRQGAASELPSFGPTFGMRKYPRTDESQQSVDEPVEVLKSNFRVTDVWLGDGELRTSLDVGKIEPVSGAVYRSGFTISGSRALKKS